MKTLAETMNDQLIKLKIKEYSNVFDFVSKDDQAQKFLQAVLTKYSCGTTWDKLENTVPSQNRSRHTAITFLLGLALAEFGDLYNHLCDTVLSKNFDYFNKKPYDRKTISMLLWIIVSSNHDIAYHSKYLAKKDLNYLKEFRYNLFDLSFEDTSSFLAYTVNDIQQYDRWAREFHSQRINDYERVDHGILGGYISWNAFLQNDSDTYSSRSLIKIVNHVSALTIAQHNLFKSNDLKEDKCGIFEKPDKLKFNSNFHISQQTPLLLYLCLIDTIECVKCFSRSEQSSKWVQTKTVLEKISIEISFDGITVDYTNLINHLQQKGISSENYFCSIEHMNVWTAFQVTKSSNTVGVYQFSLKT